MKRFSNSLSNAPGIELHQLKWQFGKVLTVQNWWIKIKSITRSLRWQERKPYIQENNNLLQEELIDDLRIPAGEMCLDISKRTFNRITERNLKWHLYKMHVRKEENNYKWSWFTEKNQDASLFSMKWRTYRRKQKLAAYIGNKNILCSSYLRYILWFHF